MGYDIRGFVEIRQEDSWDPVVAITPFNWRHYGIYRSLFGTAREGLPEDASDAPRAALAETLARYNGDFGFGWLPGIEFIAGNPNPPCGLKTMGINGFPALQEIVIALIDHYGDHNVRLVIWYNS